MEQGFLDHFLINLGMPCIQFVYLVPLPTGLVQSGD